MPGTIHCLTCSIRQRIAEHTTQINRLKEAMFTERLSDAEKCIVNEEIRKLRAKVHLARDRLSKINKQARELLEWL